MAQLPWLIAGDVWAVGVGREGGLLHLHTHTKKMLPERSVSVSTQYLAAGGAYHASGYVTR